MKIHRGISQREGCYLYYKMKRTLTEIQFGCQYQVTAEEVCKNLTLWYSTMLRRYCQYFKPNFIDSFIIFILVWASQVSVLDGAFMLAHLQLL